MLIRSQDKKQLIPVGEFVLSITLNSAITATKKLAEKPSVASQCVIGEYSVTQKAIKVLDMIQQAYENSWGVFEMPQDCEVEA